MDFSARGSYQSRQQGNNYSQSQTKQKKEESSDSFMRLSDLEIAGCINDIGVPFSTEDLKKPQPAQIQKVFEWFAELLMNTTRETVEPAMNAAARDVCGPDLSEIIPVETRNLMGFYASLRKLLAECGIHDFSFSDLTKPTHPRLVKIFSYIINFVRFREAQTSNIDAHFNKLETTKTRIETLIEDNQDLESQLEALRRDSANADAAFKDKNAHMEDLKVKLTQLQKDRDNLSSQIEAQKSEKNTLIQTLQDKVDRTTQLRQEAEKLRPYAKQSKSDLQAQITDLNSTLTNDRARIEALDKRSRALQTSSDTFTLAAKDVEPLVTSLHAVSDDLRDEEAEAQKAQKRKNQLTDVGMKVRVVEQDEAILQRQLDQWLKRTEVLRAGAQERKERAKERLGELTREYEELAREKTVRQREVEKRRIRIEQKEKMMQDLKENIEAEVSASRDEFAKMAMHIQLYIREMEQQIGG